MINKLILDSRIKLPGGSLWGRPGVRIIKIVLRNGTRHKKHPVAVNTKFCSARRNVGFPQRRPEFEPALCYVGFVVDYVPGFLTVLPLYLVIIADIRVGGQCRNMECPRGGTSVLLGHETVTGPPDVQCRLLTHS
jgi:hypothetical protein